MLIIKNEGTWILSRFPHILGLRKMGLEHCQKAANIIIERLSAYLYRNVFKKVFKRIFAEMYQNSSWYLFLENSIGVLYNENRDR